MTRFLMLSLMALALAVPAVAGDDPEGAACCLTEEATQVTKAAEEEMACCLDEAKTKVSETAAKAAEMAAKAVAAAKEAVAPHAAKAEEMACCATEEAAKLTKAATDAAKIHAAKAVEIASKVSAAVKDAVADAYGDACEMKEVDPVTISAMESFFGPLPAVNASLAAPDAEEASCCMDEADAAVAKAAPAEEALPACCLTEQGSTD